MAKETYKSKKISGDAQSAPKVSIIMSVYNPVAKYFKSAVDSVLAQSFTDWELIICNDSSTERCSSFLERVAEKDPRIHLVKNRMNSGLAVSLNKCIRHARGEFIARMDDDDFCMPDRIEKQLNFLEQHPEYSWVGSNAGLLDKDGKWGERLMPEIPTADDFLKFCPYIHPSVMFRRSVFEEYGVYKKFRRGEDYEFFMRLHSKGLRGCNIQEELFRYREDAHSSRRKGYYYQLEETGIRFRGFKKMNVLTPKNCVYVIKPMVTGLIPHKNRMRFKRLIGRY